jgi:hypothetical protein
VTDHEMAPTLSAIMARISPPELADRMVAAFRDGIPGYQRLPAQVVVGQILDISQHNVELFFRTVLEGRAPTDGDLAAFRASAKDRATEGVPLEDLLHAYRLGGRIGWHALEEAALPHERLALLHGAELLMDYVDRVSSAASQAYLEERQHLVSEEERRLRSLLDAVLESAALPIELRGLAERIGFGLADRYRPFAAAVHDAPARRHSELAFALRARGVLALTEGVRVAGLAPNGDRRLWLPGDPPAVLALAPSTTAGELATTLDDMRRLADLGLRLGKRGTLEPGELLPELLLASAPRTASELSRRALSPLDAYRAGRGSGLVETLAAYIDAKRDRRRTAARLHVHPNTLDYRLRRAFELTGLDVDDPDDLVLIVLALRQRRLTQPAAQAPSAPGSAGTSTACS